MSFEPRYGDSEYALIFKIAEMINAGGGGGGSGVSTFNGRTGAVSLTSGDINGALGFTPGNPALYVLKAGDTMSGTLTIQSPGFLEAPFVFANMADAIVNAAPVVAEVSHHSSAGTPAVGNGVSMDFSMDDATVVRQIGARLTSSWTTATHATRTSQFRFFLPSSATLTEVFRIAPANTVLVVGNFVFGTDNTQDIGASGATRPRTGYFGKSVVVNQGTITTVIPAVDISQTVNDDGSLDFVAFRISGANTTGDEQFKFISCNFNSGGGGAQEVFYVQASGNLFTRGGITLDGGGSIQLADGGGINRGSNPFNNFLTSYFSGAVYTVTNSSAEVKLNGNSQPVIIDVAGKYLLRAWVKIDLSGATFAATRTLTIKLRRLNNTAADVANAVLTFTVPITTTLSETLAFIDLPGVQYTGTATDQIAMFADINIVPSAGSIVISAGGITAMRI
jgi:hypothetical protein